MSQLESLIIPPHLQVPDHLPSTSSRLTFLSKTTITILSLVLCLAALIIATIITHYSLMMISTAILFIIISTIVGAYLVLTRNPLATALSWPSIIAGFGKGFWFIGVPLIVLAIIISAIASSSSLFKNEGSHDNSIILLLPIVWGMIAIALCITYQMMFQYITVQREKATITYGTRQHRTVSVFTAVGVTTVLLWTGAVALACFIPITDISKADRRNVIVVLLPILFLAVTLVPINVICADYTSIRAGLQLSTGHEQQSSFFLSSWSDLIIRPLCFQLMFCIWMSSMMLQSIFADSFTWPVIIFLTVTWSATAWAGRSVRQMSRQLNLSRDVIPQDN